MWNLLLREILYKMTPASPAGPLTIFTSGTCRLLAWPVVASFRLELWLADGSICDVSGVQLGAIFDSPATM